MIPLRRLALALLLALALVAGASALDGYTYSQTVEYAACDQAVYQQDLVIHRSAGTAYEETSGGLNIWHLYVGTDCQADYDDLRFTNSTGAELAYYLWPDYDSSSARFTVRLGGADQSGALVIWYGNPSATTTSDSSIVFTAYHGAASATFYDTPTFVFSQMRYDARVKYTSAGYNLLFGLADAPLTSLHDEVTIQLFTNRVYFYSRNNNVGTSVSIPYSLSRNTWYDISILHDGTTVSGYINGTKIGDWSTNLPDAEVGLFYWAAAPAGSQAYSLVRAYSAAPPAATAFLTGAAPEIPPVAEFSASPTSGTAPLTVQFTDASTGTPTSWAWVFGDGGTSDQQHPSHTYTEPGTYTVALTATNAHGEDLETKANYIAVTAPLQGAPVIAWGSNGYGQCDVPEGLEAAQVSGGLSHSVALLENGTVVAWGDNSKGQCDVPAGLVATQIVAGDEHTLALLENGTVVAWGDNSKGQCDVPAGLSGVIDLAAGRLHSLVLREDGTVVEWGSSYYYVPPSGLSGVTAVAAGRDHSLALKSDGTVVAWGSNLGGQCSPPSGLSGVTAVDGGSSFSVALKSDGTVVAWGNDYYGQSTPPAGLSDVTAIAVNQHYTLALKSDGTVVAWGWNNLGQCDVPPGLTDVDAIAAGDGHALALGFLPPTAAFTRSPSSGEPPLTVQFTDTSTGTPTSWHWDFGDSTTSTLQNPSHTYTEPGTYTVTLTVTNAYGEDTKTSYVHVYIPWAPSFTASPTSGSAPLTVQFTDTSTDDPFDWWWEFGDGDEVFSVQNPSHTYTEPGTYTVTLHAVNRYEEGGEVTREGYITVSAAPTPTPPPSSAHSLPYSQQRKETLSFLLMCWGGLAFVGVFCVVIFLLMNGAQRGSGGI